MYILLCFKRARKITAFFRIMQIFLYISKKSSTFVPDYKLGVEGTYVGKI